MPHFRLLRRGLALIGLLLIVVTCTPLVNWWARLLAGKWNEPSGEILIVLSGDSLDDHLIGYSSYWRCIYALRAIRSSPFQTVLISGRGAAPLMAEFLIRSGTPASQIEVDPDSVSTRENAINSARLLAGRPGRKVLLTSDYHVFRSLRLFHKAGLEVVPVPVPDALKRGSRMLYRWPVFLDLCLETAKIVYYYARGWI